MTTEELAKEQKEKIYLSFCTAALQGLLANPDTDITSTNTNVRRAFDCADSMYDNYIKIVEGNELE